MKISEKYRYLSEKYRYFREKSEIFGKNRAKEISVHFSFRGSPKNDISAKYRPKNRNFCPCTHMIFSFSSLFGRQILGYLLSLRIYYKKCHHSLSIPREGARSVSFKTNKGKYVSDCLF